MRHLRRREAMFEVREEMVAEVPLPVAYTIGNALPQINIEGAGARREAASAGAAIPEVDVPQPAG